MIRTYSRRFEHERTGEPLPAYVYRGYVIEKARRDWVLPRFSLGINPKEWWEVRRQGSIAWPGVSVGRYELHHATTLAECKAWVDTQPEHDYTPPEGWEAHCKPPHD